VLNIDVLTPEEMKAIDQRQARQQSEWKAIPIEGQVVTFLGIELLVLPKALKPS
jgi:hypothetical protein